MSMKPRLPQSEPQQPTQTGLKSRHRWLWVVATVVAGGLLVGCSDGIEGTVSPVSSAVSSVRDAALAAEPFTISGSLTLADAKAAKYGCYTTGGYNDIRAGTDVIVRDETGKTVALGQLGSGTSSMGSCEFPFQVRQVPAGSKFYTVEVSHRGEITFKADEARHPVSLTLGGS